MVCGRALVEALSTVGRAKKYPQSTKRRDCGRVEEWKLEECCHQTADDQCRQHICYAELRAKGQIDAHAENQH